MANGIIGIRTIVTRWKSGTYEYQHKKFMNERE